MLNWINYPFWHWERERERECMCVCHVYEELFHWRSIGISKHLPSKTMFLSLVSYSDHSTITSSQAPSFSNISSIFQRGHQAYTYQSIFPYHPHLLFKAPFWLSTNHMIIESIPFINNSIRELVHSHFFLVPNFSSFNQSLLALSWLLILRTLLKSTLCIRVKEKEQESTFYEAAEKRQISWTVKAHLETAWRWIV